MQKIKNQELQNLKGGSISGQALEALYKGVSLLLDIGMKLGSSLRRIISKKVCPIN